MQRRLTLDSGATRVEAALSSAYRRPIHIDFKDATLKQVFDVIARSANMNFLFDKDVHTDQHTSIYLRNSTIGCIYGAHVPNAAHNEVVDPAL